ncbi:hypothetical protein ACVWZL_000989 [Bradyrhizobium sp. GM2.4]
MAVMVLSLKQLNKFGLVVCVCSAFQVPVAFGQIANANSSKFQIQGPAEDTGAKIIRDGLNRPCLDIEAIARSHVVNPNMIDHVVSVKNNCSRMIKVKVCYLHSDHCKEFDLHGYKRIDTILGTMANVTSFRYSLFQK